MENILYTVIIYPLRILIECIFTLFEKLTHSNLGLSVIGVSIGVTLFCLPLYAVAEHWQKIEQEKQKSMKPGLARIKKAFTGDERYMMTTIFYKQHHYSPILALRSSFGLLIQIPFFIAAYTFLSHLETLQGESFLFIKDMGAPDALFQIGAFPINVLPIAMTLINCISGFIYTRGGSLRDKIQIYAMAAIFLIILYPSPSGLVLYWTFNNIFSLIKNIFYKLRNPLKSFYIFCCLMLIPVTIYIIFFYKNKIHYKLAYMALALVVFSIPIIKKGLCYLLKTTLSFLVQNKRRRMVIYLASCSILFLLTGLVIPSSLIASSPVEFATIKTDTNPLLYVCITALQSLGIFGFWMLCIYFLFGAKVQTLLSYLMATIACCAILDTFVFMLPYGDISSTLSFLNVVSFRTASLPSLLNGVCILVIVFVMPLLLRLKKGAVFSSVSVIVMLALSVVSIANGSTIRNVYSDFAKNAQETKSSRIEKIFHLSKSKKNIIVIMLDRGQGQYVTEILKEAPELNASLSGFTFYNNVVSFNAHTLQGVPGIYGGYEYTPYEMNSRTTTLLREKHNEAILLLPRILSESAGFEAVLTDTSWANYKDYFDTSILAPYPKITGYQLYGRYTTIWNQEHDEGENSLGDSEVLLKRNLLFFSIFREAPIFLRELIYKNSSYWNPDKTLKGAKKVIDWYSGLDYLVEMTDVSEAEGDKYISIGNELTHESLFLQAPDYIPVKTVTNFSTSKYKGNEDYYTMMASLKMLGKWFAYLKEQGAYDNTRIVIVSDHGKNGTEDDIEKDDALDAQVTGGTYRGRGHYHPLLLFKDFDASGAVQEDDTFMTNADVPSLVLRGIVETPVNPFTGKEIALDTEPLKKDGVIISVNDKHTPDDHGKYTFSIKDNEWWRVKDSIFRADSWSRAEPPETQ